MTDERAFRGYGKFAGTHGRLVIVSSSLLGVLYYFLGIFYILVEDVSLEADAEKATVFSRLDMNGDSEVSLHVQHGANSGCQRCATSAEACCDGICSYGLLIM